MEPCSPSNHKIFSGPFYKTVSKPAYCCFLNESFKTSKLSLNKFSPSPLHKENVSLTPADLSARAEKIRKEILGNEELHPLQSSTITYATINLKFAELLLYFTPANSPALTEAAMRVEMAKEDLAGAQSLARIESICLTGHRDV